MSFIFIDIETDDSKGFGLDPYRSTVVTFQAMTTAKKPLILHEPKNLDSLKEKLENNVVVGHNIKFESKYLKLHFGVTLKNVYDTQIAENVLAGGTKSLVPLKDLVFKYCGVVLNKDLQRSFIPGGILSSAQIDYALQDILYLPEIMKRQLKEIERLGLHDILDIEMKAIPAVSWLELSGINVDIEKLKEIEIFVTGLKKESEETLIKELTRTEKGAAVQLTLDNELPKIVPRINSPLSLLDALLAKGYDKLTGTGKKELAKYQGDSLITELQIFRKNEKLLSGFIRPILGYENEGEEVPSRFVNTKTGRVHADFNQYGALSGRFSCTKPNMQQQPSRYEDWRHIYVASPGNKIIAADYSQIELRIIGQLSGDQKYIKAYREKLDLHKETASQMFHVPLREVTKQQRNIAKSINFGLNYGMGASGLKDKLKIDVGIDVTEEEAQRLKKVFQKLYPSVTKYLSNAGEKGYREGSIRTLGGRLCKTIDPDGKKVEEYTIKNRGKNLPVQGLCSDMLKIAMGSIFLILEPRGVRLINSVHDELVFECRAEESEEISQVIKVEMEKAGNLFLKELPCLVEVTIDDYWKKE
jgi:DNA polymerase I-like protein with 3'-5' exonuclease and polymerase domains